MPDNRTNLSHACHRQPPNGTPFLKSGLCQFLSSVFFLDQLAVSQLMARHPFKEVFLIGEVPYVWQK